jgi:hypothetical protein
LKDRTTSGSNWVPVLRSSSSRAFQGCMPER